MLFKNKAGLEKALVRARRPRAWACLLTQMCWPDKPTNKMEHLEERYGIPITLLHLIEGLYASLPATEQSGWVAKLLSYVEDGADLRAVVNHFLIWLTDPQDGVIISISSGEWDTARATQDAREAREARDAARDAWAAREAAWAAREAARDAEEEAAWAAREAAREAARAAWDTAWAAWAARDAWAAQDAREGAWAAWAAWDTARDSQRAKLESLLQNCNHGPLQ